MTSRENEPEQRAAKNKRNRAAIVAANELEDKEERRAGNRENGRERKGTGKRSRRDSDELEKNKSCLDQRRVRAGEKKNSQGLKQRNSRGKTTEEDENEQEKVRARGGEHDGQGTDTIEQS